MNLRSRRTEDLSLNVTPLIDVVFLLLIFFMITTTFDHESELKIELPEAKGKVDQQKKDKISIVIDASGKFTVEGKEVVNTHAETLKRVLHKVAGDQENPRIIISGDKAAPHQSIMTAMSAAQQLGFTRLTFAAIQPQ